MLRRAALLSILMGAGILLYAIFSGEAHVALLLIFPVVYGSGFYSLVGILLIMLGIFLLFLSPFESLEREAMVYPEESENEYVENKEKTKFGGVILIGPIPIVFGSDRNMLRISIFIGLLMLSLLVIFYVLFL